MLKRSLIIFVVIALLAASGYYGWGRLRETVKVEPPQLVAVRKDAFVHEILGRGSVDSARNQEIRVRVESARMGGLTIVTVVPEGTLVEAGDLLVELDSAWLREQVERQQVSVIEEQSRLEQSLADLKNAELTLTEYLEGTFVQSQMTIQNEIFTAEEQVRTQGEQVINAERMFERGYVTKTQLDAAIIEYEKAEKAEEIAKKKLEILETFTKEKMVTQYKAAINTIQETVKARELTLKIATDRLNHLKQQLENCKIYAPNAGQVVYYMPRWGGEADLIREGKGVSDKEILLHLPDPTQMQVKGLVNESNVRYIRPGQKASIRLEAFLNDVFEGEVTQVNSFPEPSGFGAGPMSREYLTTVRILNPPEGVKTGLTAEARIVVNEIPNALLLPTQAIFAHGGKTYAITFKEGKWDKVEIKIGPANDREVMILEGLDVGDEVVLGAMVHRDKVDLPKVEEESEYEEDPGEEDQFLEQMRREATQQQGGQGGGQGEGQGGQQEGGRRGGARPSGGPPGGGGPRP